MTHKTQFGEEKVVVDSLPADRQRLVRKDRYRSVLVHLEDVGGAWKDTPLLLVGHHEEMRGVQQLVARQEKPESARGGIQNRWSQTQQARHRG